MTTRLNADLDADLYALYEACAADSEYDSKSDYVRALIREDAERRGLTPDDASTDDEDVEESSIAETYDPDELRTSPLTFEELEELARESVPEINPAHVPDDVDDFVQKTGLKAAVVAAAARHGYEKVTRDDLVDLTEDIWGRGGNGYYVDKDNANLPGRALDRLWRDIDSLGSRDADDEYYALTASEYLPKWIASTNVFEENVEDNGWNSWRDKEVDLLRRQGQEMAKAGADVEEIRPRMDALGEMAENKSADTTGLPDGVDPMFADDMDRDPDTAEEWLERTRKAINDDENPVGALQARINGAEKIIEENSDHPNVGYIEQARDELEEEVERRQQSDDDDSDDSDNEAAEEVEEKFEKMEKAEEADDEDENQPDDDRSETEKKREAIERKGGDPTATK